jgi:hypothetical protein
MQRRKERKERKSFPACIAAVKQAHSRGPNKNAKESSQSARVV